MCGRQPLRWPPVTPAPHLCPCVLMSLPLSMAGPSDLLPQVWQSDGMSLSRLGYNKALASTKAFWAALSFALREAISHFVSFPVELMWASSP